MNARAKLFFAFGALFAVIGMSWGIGMAASGNHAMAPAHAHLNLIGFVTMSIYGAYYALSPRAAAGRLTLIHLIMGIASAVLLVPGIYLAISEQGETLAKIGSLVTILTMILFLFVVVKTPAEDM